MSNIAVKAKGKKKHNIPGYLFILSVCTVLPVLYFISDRVCRLEQFVQLVYSEKYDFCRNGELYQNFPG